MAAVVEAERVRSRLRARALRGGDNEAKDDEEVRWKGSRRRKEKASLKLDETATAAARAREPIQITRREVRVVTYIISVGKPRSYILYNS
jgi:hypothetical protein